MIEDNKFQPTCYLHDYYYYSFFYGEPHTTDGVLWFYDGKDIRIVGYDERLKPIDKKTVESIYL